eukprot:257899-Amphidinium_carterae.1
MSGTKEHAGRDARAGGCSTCQAPHPISQCDNEPSSGSQKRFLMQSCCVLIVSALAVSTLRIGNTTGSVAMPKT